MPNWHLSVASNTAQLERRSLYYLHSTSPLITSVRAAGCIIIPCLINSEVSHSILLDPVWSLTLATSLNVDHGCVDSGRTRKNAVYCVF